MPRRLAAIMFSDIAGFAALTQRDEKAALQLLQEQERLVLSLLETHRGRQVKSTGDAFLLEFSNALDTIEYAVDLQRRLHDRNARLGAEPLRLRVAIHLGDIQDVGTDIFGDAVNIAAHILPLADPGSICLSEPVYVQVRNKVPYQLERLGSRFLKGVQGPTELYRVVLPWEDKEVPTTPLLSRRLAAIMITDVVGFTASAQANEADALARLREQEGIVRPLFEPFKGREIKSTGDGFLVEFESALGALGCAVEIQRRMRERNSSKPGQPLELRIGIHIGDVEESGGDIFGDAVNIASRVEPLAEPGGVCLSEPAFVQVRSKAPYHLEKLGAKTLKGINEPMEVYRVELPWKLGATPAGGPLPPRLAVLPLTNMSPDPTDEYFADGLTEELISTISRVRDLSVISRTSVMQYKGHPKHVAEIGRELNVGTILEGSVRRAGNRVRIAIQLIDPAADKHLWAESYDRNLDDIFSIQSEIAEKVATSLKVHLLEEDKDRLKKAETRSAEAYTLLLKGKFHLHRWDQASLKTAIQYFEDAIAQDPNYPAAYADLAYAHSILGFLGLIAPKEADSKAEEYARRALELDESLAQAHVSLAFVLQNRYDLANVDRELQRALELDPNSVEAHLRRSERFAHRRQYADSLREVETALELDPFSINTEGWAGTRYLYAGQYDKAIRHLKNALELDPKSAFSLNNLGLAHIRKGMVKVGLDEVERAAELSSSPSYQDLAYAYVRAGKPGEARSLLEKLLQSNEGRPASSIAIAGIYASLEEKERALEWLERAYEERIGYLVGINSDFVFDSLHDEPRFQTLLKKMNLA